MDILAILKKLVAFRSITPSGKEALEFIADLLISYGFTCDIQDFGQGEGKTSNLYAYLGNNKPNICFAGHIDVVPPGDLAKWSTDPFSLEIKGEEVYGRGVVDMKGAIAAFMAATVKYLEEKKQPTGAISFLLTTDEEGTGVNGLIKMLEYIKEKYNPIDFCIIGEPTCEQEMGDIVLIGRRGSVNFELTIYGVQGHVAYPRFFSNPMPILLQIMQELNITKFDNGSDFFEPTNLEITSIDTDNLVTNIIPSFTTARFNIRFNDKHNEETLLALVTKIVEKYSRNYKLSHACSSNSFVQKYSANMQKFAEIVYNNTKIKPAISTNGGISDARYIHKYSEVVEFGTKTEQAHKINEHCKISDLQKLYNVYYSYLMEIL